MLFLGLLAPLRAEAFPEKIDVQKMESPTAHTLQLDQFKKPTLLFFWASWCNYCQEVLPELVKIQKANPKLRIIGISVDENKKDAVFAKANKYNAITRQYWVGPKLLEDLKIKTIPLVVLINKNGIIDTIYEGSKPDKIHYLKKRVSLLKPNSQD